MYWLNKLTHFYCRKHFTGIVDVDWSKKKVKFALRNSHSEETKWICCFQLGYLWQSITSLSLSFTVQKRCHLSQKCAVMVGWPTVNIWDRVVFKKSALQSWLCVIHLHFLFMQHFACPQHESFEALACRPLEFTLIYCINLHEEINACSIITVKLLRAQLSWHT